MPEPRASASQKREVAARAAGCCEYCRSQERYSPQPFAAEHIVPLSRGGKTHIDNLAYSCQGCNNHKFNRVNAYDTVTGELVPLFQPRQQQWRDHFAWNEDFTVVIGLTPSGRATIDALRLNRSGLQNLRRITFAAGVHPPAEE